MTISHADDKDNKSTITITYPADATLDEMYDAFHAALIIA